MKRTIRILSVVCLLALCLTLGAPALAAPVGGYCGDDVRWSLSNGVLTITGKGEMTDYPVSVAVPWHHYAASIHTLMVGDGVTSLGDRALYGCTGLLSVSLPATLRRIGRSAFYGCSAVPVIVLPDNLEEIGPYAFRGCKSLVAISLPGKLVSIGAYAFAKDAAMTTIQIPQGVTALEEGVFCGCRSLQLVALPTSVEKIDRFAFTDCVSYPAVIYSGSLSDRALFVDKDAGLASEQIGGTVTGGRSLYRVQDGDNLEKISQRFYGTSARWTEIYEANKTVIGENPNLIFLGTVLIIPKA